MYKQPSNKQKPKANGITRENSIKKLSKKSGQKQQAPSTQKKIPNKNRNRVNQVNSESLKSGLTTQASRFQLQHNDASKVKREKSQSEMAKTAKNSSGALTSQRENQRTLQSSQAFNQEGTYRQIDTEGRQQSGFNTAMSRDVTPNNLRIIDSDIFNTVSYRKTMTYRNAAEDPLSPNYRNSEEFRATEKLQKPQIQDQNLQQEIDVPRQTQYFYSPKNNAKISYTEIKSEKSKNVFRRLTEQTQKNMDGENVQISKLIDQPKQYKSYLGSAIVPQKSQTSWNKNDQRKGVLSPDETTKASLISRPSETKSFLSLNKQFVHPFNPPTENSLLTQNIAQLSRRSKKIPQKDKKIKVLNTSRVIEAPLLQARLEKSYPLQSKNGIIQSPRVTIDVNNQQVFAEKMDLAPETPKIPQSRKAGRGYRGLQENVKAQTVNISMIGGDSPAEADAFSDASRNSVVSRTSSMGKLWSPKRMALIQKQDTIGDLFASGMGVAANPDQDIGKQMAKLPNNRKSQKNINRQRDQMITGSTDFKACLQPNYDEEPQIQKQTKNDYYLNLLHTGVRIVDLNEMPAYRLNSQQRTNFASEFQPDLVQRKKDTVNTHMRAVSMDRVVISNVVDDEPLTKIQKEIQRSIQQQANQKATKKIEFSSQKLGSNDNIVTFGQARDKIDEPKMFQTKARAQTSRNNADLKIVTQGENTKTMDVITNFNQARIVPAKPLNKNFAKSFVLLQTVDNQGNNLTEEYKTRRRQAQPENRESTIFQNREGALSRQSSKAKYAHAKNKSQIVL